MHASFNGMSMVRTFSIAEVMELLVSSRDAEEAHLERSLKQKGQSSGEAFVMFTKLIRDKIDRYQAAIDVADTLSDDENTIQLDISRPLSSQILESYVEHARKCGTEKKALKAIPASVRSSLKL